MAVTSAPGTTVLLTRLAKVVYRRCSEQALGMRLKEFIALTLLRDHGDVPQQVLGEALALDANNLVLLLNELEDAGFAKRRRDPHDRRRHIVTITAAGRRAVERGEKGLGSVEDDVLAALGPDERATLRSLLERALAGAPATPLSG
jgi:DNA-binding MarR family transcriptional regulator